MNNMISRCSDKISRTQSTLWEGRSGVGEGDGGFSVGVFVLRLFDFFLKSLIF